MLTRSFHIPLLRIGACKINQKRGTPLYACWLKQRQSFCQGLLSLIQERLCSSVIRMIQTSETDALIACQSRTIKVEPVYFLFGILAVFELLSYIKCLQTRSTL